MEIGYAINEENKVISISEASKEYNGNYRCCNCNERRTNGVNEACVNFAISVESVNPLKIALSWAQDITLLRYHIHFQAGIFVDIEVLIVKFSDPAGHSA